MRYSYSRALLWLIMYLLSSLILLAIAVSGTIPEKRGFWIELGTAFGFIGLAMLGLQFIFSGRITKIATTFGMDNILHFHKAMGLVAFAFVFMHPVTLLLANPEFNAYFDPTTNILRAFALSFASVALFFIIATSLWRISFGLSYEKWRLVHGLLALALVFIGTVHALQVEHYLNAPWKKVLLVLLMGSSMYLVIHTRIIRPWKNRKKPYQVNEVIKERDSCWTLRLKAIDHPRLSFTCGQFAWLTINERPFSMQQHPFSIASSEKDEMLSFTAKESGDFTSTWKEIKPGTKVFIEGPFGSFTPKGDKNLFLVMGGIGATPAMSMLRTLRDKKDPRKITFIYGNKDWKNIIFREELEDMKKDLNIKLIHLLMEPDDDWDGEKGVVDQEFLEKYLPKKPDDYMYYICGPKPMMDITEIALRNLNIDWRHIYTERFEIV